MKPVQAIFIEAGHRYFIPPLQDGAYNWKRHVSERQITVDIARRVLAILETKKKEMKYPLIQGVGVETNANVSKKIQYVNNTIRANSFNPEHCYGISLHVNGCYNRSGIMAYFGTRRHESKEKILADYILDSEHDYFNVKVEGIRPDTSSRFGRLYIQDAICPYILVEMGYIGHEGDLDRMLNLPDRLAESVAHGIMQYLRN